MALGPEKLQEEGLVCWGQPPALSACSTPSLCEKQSPETSAEGLGPPKLETQRVLGLWTTAMTFQGLCLVWQNGPCVAIHATGGLSAEEGPLFLAHMHTEASSPPIL